MSAAKGTSTGCLLGHCVLNVDYYYVVMQFLQLMFLTFLIIYQLSLLSTHFITLPLQFSLSENFTPKTIRRGGIPGTILLSWPAFRYLSQEMI